MRGMKLGAGDALAAIYLLNAEDVVNIEVKGKEVALNRLRTADVIRRETNDETDKGLPDLADYLSGRALLCGIKSLLFCIGDTSRQCR